jgi:hypothetical protein
MKQDKNKIKEPYDPEHTPKPPQIIEPNTHEERNDRDEPVEDRKNDGLQPGSGQEQKKKKEEKPKLLGESETEIDDETTI